MQFGCTGHQTLSSQTRRNVAAAIAGILADQTDVDLVGVGSLAEGADQLFAFAVLAAGGQLHAVVPSAEYEDSFTSDRARSTYLALLSFAVKRIIMDYDRPSEDAYLAAGHKVVDSCDVLIAVWDGNEAAGKGGTGDIVEYARRRGRAVQIVWPDGAQRV